LLSQAKDKGSPSLESNTTIEISLIDTNDNVPKFSSPVYYASVPENAYGGYQVIRVSATDADEGTNAQLAYNIVSGGDGKFIIEGLFTLDPVLGSIRVSRPLDRETNKTITLTVLAKDQGIPQLSDQASVVIYLTDVNDNAPVIRPRNMSAAVPENMPVGTTVGEVSASDNDIGTN
ncbi:predicted protein, partial [Nematostella vectensis]